MNKQELIERIEGLKNIFGNKTKYIEKNTVIELVSKLDEPKSGHADEAPRYVKNVLARLRELPLHNREVWLKVIMSEFGQDFSNAKWREGYEQGKVEGMVEREKVKIPSVVAQWIGYAKGWNKGLNYALSNASDEVLEWLCVDKLKRQEIFARAWIDGYEIQETRYVVTDGNHLYFKGYQEDVDIVILVDEQPGTMEYVKKFNTKEEAQKAADILGWKVQEVE